MASISLRCLKVLSPFWTTSLRCCDSSSTHKSFWFTLDTSYNHGCHFANRFHLDPKDYEVVPPLVVTPWCRLVMPAGCCIASCHLLIAMPSHRLVVPAGCCIVSCCPLTALPSRCLVTPAGCHIASRRPLVAPPSCQLVAPAFCCIASPHPLVAPHTTLSSSRRTRTDWLLRRLSTRRPLVVLSSRRAASRCLITPAGCRVIISCRPLVAPHSHPSHRAGWLLRCLSLRRPLVLLA